MAHEQFYITSELSEDMFDAANTLQDAIRIAREVVRTETVGDSVNIQFRGKVIRKFVLTAGGKVEEEVLA